MFMPLFQSQSSSVTSRAAFPDFFSLPLSPEMEKETQQKSVQLMSVTPGNSPSSTYGANLYGFESQVPIFITATPIMQTYPMNTFLEKSLSQSKKEEDSQSNSEFNVMSFVTYQNNMKKRKSGSPQISQNLPQRRRSTRKPRRTPPKKKEKKRRRKIRRKKITFKQENPPKQQQQQQAQPQKDTGGYFEKVRYENSIARRRPKRNRKTRSVCMNVADFRTENELCCVKGCKECCSVRNYTSMIGRLEIKESHIGKEKLKICNLHYLTDLRKNPRSKKKKKRKRNKDDEEYVIVAKKQKTEPKTEVKGEEEGVGYEGKKFSYTSKKKSFELMCLDVVAKSKKPLMEFELRERIREKFGCRIDDDYPSWELEQLVNEGKVIQRFVVRDQMGNGMMLYGSQKAFAEMDKNIKSTKHHVSSLFDPPPPGPQQGSSDMFISDQFMPYYGKSDFRRSVDRGVKKIQLEEFVKMVNKNRFAYAQICRFFVLFFENLRGIQSLKTKVFLSIDERERKVENVSFQGERASESKMEFAKDVFMKFSNYFHREYRTAEYLTILECFMQGRSFEDIVQTVEEMGDSAENVIVKKIEDIVQNSEMFANFEEAIL